jgi:glycosyltransferase involved in cell wall biosynthesis
MAMPAVSVVLPVRNRARELPTLLSHLEQQSFPAADLEVVIVDDGSRDGTDETARRYAAGAPVRMHCLRQAYCARARALNLGIHESHGEWVLFLDEELLASPQWVEGHVRALQAMEGRGFTVGPVLPHPQLSEDALTRWFLSDVYPDVHASDVLSWVDCSASNLGVPRAALMKLHGFDEGFPHSMGTGRDLAYRLSGEGIQPRFVEEANAYIGFSCTFNEVYVHCYRLGYSLYRLAEHTDTQMIQAAFPVRPRLLRRLMDAVSCPYYRQFFGDSASHGGVRGSMLRRVFIQQVYRGFQDARRGRAPDEPVVLD